MPIKGGSPRVWKSHNNMLIYCKSSIASLSSFNNYILALGTPSPLFSIMSQQLIMIQLSTGLHSVLNSLNIKGKVSVDGTPKDAFCRLYFSIQLN